MIANIDMKLNKIFLSLCFMVICAIGFAQTANDYMKAAEQGNAKAQYNLGYCYLQGKGVSQDYTQAFTWFKKAAEQGIPDAQLFLGTFYYDGSVVNQDYTQAIYWFRKAAEQGNALGQYYLGRCYQYGRGETKNKNQAVYWFRKAAEQGFVEAQNEMGICYYYGDGVNKDYSQAVYWFKKAADQGHAEAQCKLGSCYKNGDGVNKDYSQAVHWFKKAADQEYVYAQYEMGICYYYGHGVVEDKNLALEWFSSVIDNPNATEEFIPYAEMMIDDILAPTVASAIDELLFGKNTISTSNGHEYVDLGLSVLWATCNIGASSSEEYGNYFAWGEINPQKIYNWNNLKYYINGNSSDNVQFSKYVTDSKYGTVDNKTTLELADDAANANWGGDWRMPTYEEVVELEKNCKCELISINGVKGSRFISIKNGNSIFLPFAGGYDGANLDEVGSFGYYWSSSISSDNSQDAKLAYFDTNSIGTGTIGRYNGLSIRPVMEKKTAQSTPSSSNNLNSSEKVYSSTEVDIAPKFNGGDMGEFTKWVNQNVVYPDIAKQYDIKGRVITKFTIHSNGQISDIQILKGVDPSLDKEAINVLKKAQTLTPAKKGGENVAMSYMLPIDFGR